MQYQQNKCSIAKVLMFILKSHERENISKDGFCGIMRKLRPKGETMKGCGFCKDVFCQREDKPFLQEFSHLV